MSSDYSNEMSSDYSNKGRKKCYCEQHGVWTDRVMILLINGRNKYKRKIYQYRRNISNKKQMIDEPKNRIDCGRKTLNYRLATDKTK